LAIPSSSAEIKMSTWGNDQYCRCRRPPPRHAPSTREDKKPVVKLAGYGAARQALRQSSADDRRLSGGMLRKTTCDKLPDEATCRPAAQDRLQRLRRVGQGHKFCTKEFTKTAGLRACDKAHPCREDISAPPAMTTWPSQAWRRHLHSALFRSSSSASTATPEAGTGHAVSIPALPRVGNRAA